MPPKRKSPATVAPAAGSPRKTRSMTGAGKRGVEAAPAKASPAKKEEEKAAVHNGRKRGPKKDVTEKEAAEPKGRKKAKKGADSEAAAKEEDGGGAAADGKRVIVEACTQCRQFKIRAQKVKEDLESSVSGVSVIINPEKPRRGCLEIREEGGEVFISLLNMPRPFTAMKKLNMDEVIKDIAKKIS